MPTYTVALANLSLTSEQESAIAAAITESHHISTGAPGFFAQVLFVKIPPGKHYIGGKICQAPHMFVHGLIRAGRSADAKLSLVNDITMKIRETAGLGPEGHLGLHSRHTGSPDGGVRASFARAGRRGRMVPRT